MTKSNVDLSWEQMKGWTKRSTPKAEWVTEIGEFETWFVYWIMFNIYRLYETGYGRGGNFSKNLNNAHWKCQLFIPNWVQIRDFAIKR